MCGRNSRIRTAKAARICDGEHSRCSRMCKCVSINSPAVIIFTIVEDVRGSPQLQSSLSASFTAMLANGLCYQ